MFAPPQSEEGLPVGDDGCCFPFACVVCKEILTAESDSLPGFETGWWSGGSALTASPDETVHPSTHHVMFTDCLLRMRVHSSVACVHVRVNVCVYSEMNVC